MKARKQTREQTKESAKHMQIRFFFISIKSSQIQIDSKYSGSAQPDRQDVSFVLTVHHSPVCFKLYRNTKI